MKIVSLSPATTEILFALGKGGLLIGRDQFSNYPQAAKSIPELRGHQKVDINALSDLKPDLVFTSTVIQEKLAEEIRATELQCVHQDPRSLNDVYQSILEIGTLLDCESESRALTEKMRKEMNQVKKRTHSLPQKLRVYIEEWHDPPMASGNWVPEILRIAGGKELPGMYGVLSREVTLDEIKAFDPEMIVLSICGAGTTAEKSLIINRPGWDVLQAVQNGKVFVIDDSFLNRPGPRLTEGAKRLYSWIFEALH